MTESDLTWIFILAQFLQIIVIHFETQASLDLNTQINILSIRGRYFFINKVSREGNKIFNLNSTSSRRVSYYGNLQVKSVIISHRLIRIREPASHYPYHPSNTLFYRKGRLKKTYNPSRFPPMLLRGCGCSGSPSSCFGGIFKLDINSRLARQTDDLHFPKETSMNFIEIRKGRVPSEPRHMKCYRVSYANAFENSLWQIKAQARNGFSAISPRSC